MKTNVRRNKSYIFDTEHISGHWILVAVKSSCQRNLPALNSLDKVAKFSEGCFMSPDAQTVHIGHVSGFRGT